ncbi:hypothetical protein L210DRAFT_944741 [Boletus edulis BED1]|uniref:Secreted protein n=1 Tax=Boletus edulis BED1 TaxID=1328754 RepID=A0AAD4BTU7_BOLED|nr:hypothetical protein L210DRAFT_944741 [Boletus edulis BED1]
MMGHPMAVMRLLLLIVGVVAHQVGMTPHNVQPPNEQLREQRGLERSVNFVLGILRVCDTFSSLRLER